MRGLTRLARLPSWPPGRAGPRPTGSFSFLLGRGTAGRSLDICSTRRPDLRPGCGVPSAAADEEQADPLTLSILILRYMYEDSRHTEVSGRFGHAPLARADEGASYATAPCDAQH